MPSVHPAQVVPLDDPDVPAAARLLAQGTDFSPQAMARVLRARAAAGTGPTLLAARTPAGELVGSGLVDPHRPVAGGRLFTRAAVAPHARGQGTGRALAAALVHTLPDGHAPLSVEVDLDDLRSQEFAVRAGGVAYQRTLALRVDLHDPAARATSPAPAGLHVEAMTADAPEERWRAAFAVYARASMDLPDRAGAPEPSWEMFRAQTEHAPGVLLAVADGVPVGISAAGPDEDDHWYVLFTGTLRGVRRRGVARALKGALHRTALEQGARWLSTSTLDVNVAMLALNAQLGYRRTGGVVRMQVG